MIPRQREVPGGSVEYFIASRSDDWRELDAMLAKLGRRPLAKLGPENLGRFAHLYRAAAADLAYARLRYRHNPVVGRLNALVNRAHGVLYTERRDYVRRGGAFLASGFPQVVRRQARFVWIGAVATLAGAAGGILWQHLDPASAQNALFAEASCSGLNTAGHTLGPLSSQILSAVSISLHNIWVAMLAFALGALACLGAVYLLVYNGLMIGALGAYAFGCGKGTDFVALVAPHGTIELTIIVIAGAAGMRIGWALLAPGRLRRSAAVRDAGAEAVRMLAGTVPFFLLAGTVEGFVTPAGLPVAANVAVSLVLGAMFWTYLSTFGRPGMPGAPPPRPAGSRAASIPAALSRVS